MSILTEHQKYGLSKQLTERVFSQITNIDPIKMATVSLFSTFCTIISLFLRRDFNVPKVESDAVKTLLKNKDTMVQKADIKIMQLSKRLCL